MKVQLPTSQRDAFAAFIALDAVHLEILSQALKSMPLSYDYDALGQRIGPDVGISPLLMSQMLSMFTTMAQTCDQQRWSIDEFTTNIFEASLALKRPDLVPKEETAQQCRSVLVEVLSPGSSLWRIAKGSAVIAENAHLMLDVRIMTDLRPVFSTGDNITLEGSSITHLIRLAYRVTAEDKEFYVTADVADLKKFQKAIERALKKHDLLREFVGDRIPFVDSTL